jgi:DNA-binding transcriptional regulator YdaS (Cro superfamily)
VQWRTVVTKPDVQVAYKDSAAARLLSDGLANAASERGLSQRALAKQLGYKQSVVLSHMALGRVPIPLERAAQFADLLLLDKREFVTAVLAQRLPDIDWSELISSGPAPTKASEMVSCLEALAQGSLDALSLGQKTVMREVAADQYAEERWLSVHEVPAIALLRSLRPNMGSDGLSLEDREAITEVLTGQSDCEQTPAIF